MWRLSLPSRYNTAGGKKARSSGTVARYRPPCVIRTEIRSSYIQRTSEGIKMAEQSNPNARSIVVMHGDQTGEELLTEALRVLAPGVIELELDFQHFDLSLENRRLTKNEVVKEAAAAMTRTGLGIKAATITPTEQNDVGSPNAILREEIDGTVILRTGRRIPRVRPVGGVHAPISVVRMAVDDAYGAKEWREKTSEEMNWRIGRRKSAGAFAGT